MEFPLASGRLLKVGDTFAWASDPPRNFNVETLYTVDRFVLGAGTTILRICMKSPDPPHRVLQVPVELFKNEAVAAVAPTGSKTAAGAGASGAAGAGLEEEDDAGGGGARVDDKEATEGSNAGKALAVVSKAKTSAKTKVSSAANPPPVSSIKRLIDYVSGSLAPNT